MQKKELKQLKRKLWYQLKKNKINKLNKKILILLLHNKIIKEQMNKKSIF